MNDRLTRIGIFYDGNFFSVVSNYYNYHHPRRSRISIKGLHEFIRQRVAMEEQVDPRRCQVVDVHYFRGRFSADEAQDAGKLYDDRVFDDVLIREGVVTHYLPMGYSGAEKGIDVWFALEAFELAMYKRFDVCALVAGDSDYVPLVRKLNTVGTRVMVVGWDFEYQDGSGRTHTTRTSHTLLSEVTYPVLVSSLIDDPTEQQSVDGLFLRRGYSFEDDSDAEVSAPDPADPSRPTVNTQLTDEDLMALIRFIREGERQDKIITISSTARHYRIAGWDEEQLRSELVRLTNEGVFRQAVEEINGNAVRRLYLNESHPVVAQALP